jgi:hypothetical protein
VIDVGYAGVIGADKLVHGKSLYGHWPSDNVTGDTYGPVNYYAYVPFRQLFGWSGHWDQLPAGHAAAIAFDLLTLLGLFLLGRQIRGPTLGTVLAYGWAANPFTAYTLQSNSNDSLLSLLLVLALLVLARPAARGAAAALAGFTKFAPLVLGPLLLRGAGSWPGARRVAVYIGSFAVVSVLVMLPVLLAGGLHTFWKDTIARQADRSSPFSIWGLWGGLSTEQHIVQVAAGLLAVAVAFFPRRRTIVEVAALGAAVTIAFQLGLTHWFYLYVVWFLPFVLVAMFGAAGTDQPDVADVRAQARTAEPAGLEPVPA